MRGLVPRISLGRQKMPGFMPMLSGQRLNAAWKRFGARCLSVFVMPGFIPGIFTGGGTAANLLKIAGTSPAMTGWEVRNAEPDGIGINPGMTVCLFFMSLVILVVQISWLSVPRRPPNPDPWSRAAACGTIAAC